jgi:rubrerythrin
MKKRFQFRKIAYYVCSYCGTKKKENEILLQCPNCGAYMTTVVAKEVNLGKRQPFLEDDREMNPK